MNNKKRIDRWLPGVPGEAIERLFKAALGNEIATGNFDNLESSAALAANTFGWFFNKPRDLPPLPGCEQAGWPARQVLFEQTIHFPWSGGSHPVLDVLVKTSSALIGIESKRFEPFRGKSRSDLSKEYWRPLWGDNMKGYERIRNRLRDGDRDTDRYFHLDAAQLFKHAFALRTAVQNGAYRGLTPILFYIYAEPELWLNKQKPVAKQDIERHRKEIQHFAREVEGNEVRFVDCSYQTLLTDWSQHKDPGIRTHAMEVNKRFAPFAP